MIKYGFVYIWFDSYRKMYYVGCRWGSENDGYICSSNRMRDAYRRRPSDFKRRILSRIYTNRRDLLEEEYKWLSKIKLKDLGKKYYNLRQHHFGHWSTDTNKLLTISKIFKERKASPETKLKLSLSHKGQIPWNKELILSDKHKQNLSISHKGQIPWNKGKKASEKSKLKMSMAKLGKIPWNKGKPMSESSKLKLSIAQKERYQNYGVCK